MLSFFRCSREPALVSAGFQSRSPDSISNCGRGVRFFAKPSAKKAHHRPRLLVLFEVSGGGRGMAIGGGERPGSAPQRSPGLIHCSSQLWLRDTLVGNLLYSKLIGIPVRPHRACPRCRALASVETWVETRRLGSSDGHSPEICRVGAVCGSIPFLEWGVEDSGSSARPAKSDTNTTSPLG